MSRPTRLRIVLLAQLAGTLAVLAWVPNNYLKLAIFLALWWISFYPIQGRESALFFVACLFFSIMDVQTVKQGVSLFIHPDVWGVPVFEFAMWGFYLLHTRRMIGGAAPAGPDVKTWVLALLYAAAFAWSPDSHTLLFAASVLLAAALWFFHDPFDLRYVGYMVILGAAVEYTGTAADQWQYPGPPFGGVPILFITLLWGGVGIFLRRLALPLLSKRDLEARHA